MSGRIHGTYERERRTEEEERQKTEINTAQQERRKGRKGEIVDADRESCNLFPMAPVPNSVVTALQSPRL